MHRAIIIPQQPSRTGWARHSVRYTIKPHILMNIQTVILHREYEKHTFDAYRRLKKKERRGPPEHRMT